MKQKTAIWLLLVILNKIAYNNACTKQSLDSRDDGNSPLIIDVEEVFQLTSLSNRQTPPQTSQAPAATVASPESVSEGALSTDSVPRIETPETATSIVVSVS